MVAPALVSPLVPSEAKVTLIPKTVPSKPT